MLWKITTIFLSSNAYKDTCHKYVIKIYLKQKYIFTSFGAIVSHISVKEALVNIKSQNSQTLGHSKNVCLFAFALLSLLICRTSMTEDATTSMVIAWHGPGLAREGLGAATV